MTTYLDLYYAIAKAYSSRQNDSPQEIKMACDLLIEALKSGEATQEQLITKAKQYAALTEDEGGMKYKVSNIIANKYWTRTYVKPIVRKKFRPE